MVMGKENPLSSDTGTDNSGRKIMSVIPRIFIEDAAARLRALPTDEERIRQLYNYGGFKWLIWKEIWPSMTSPTSPRDAKVLDKRKSKEDRCRRHKPTLLVGNMMTLVFVANAHLGISTYTQFPADFVLPGSVDRVTLKQLVDGTRVMKGMKEEGCGWESTTVFARSQSSPMT
jgi:hypothetical protein